MKYVKRLAAVSAAAVLAVSALSACGSSEQAATSEPVATDNVLTAKYGDYVKSYTSEVTDFIDGDMDSILNGVADINDANYGEWKSLYEKGYENAKRWYNELSAAQMLCGEDDMEFHQELTQTVGTLYKIMEGFEDRVAAADNGDFSELHSKAAEYKDADTIIHSMWEKVLVDADEKF